MGQVRGSWVALEWVVDGWGQRGERGHEWPANGRVGRRAHSQWTVDGRTAVRPDTATRNGRTKKACSQHRARAVRGARGQVRAGASRCGQVWTRIWAFT